MTEKTDALLKQLIAATLVQATELRQLRAVISKRFPPLQDKSSAPAPDTEKDVIKLFRSIATKLGSDPDA